jgi:UDP-N-acetylmuramyl pentapeptide phosphotransferase/UDP-N-acetylglucosamine-1-phosphate transferase
MTIEFVLGLFLFVASLIAYSALHSEHVSSRIFNLRKLGVYTLLYVVILTIQGLTGIAVSRFGLDPVVHTSYSFSLFLALSLFSILKLLMSIYKVSGSIHIGKEAMDCYVYVFVTIASVVTVSRFVNVTQSIDILIVAGVHVVLLVLGVYLLKKYRSLSALVDCVDVISSLKIICFAFALYGVCAVLKDFTVYGCSLTLSAHLAFLSAGINLLREIVQKYYLPLKKIGV